MTKTFKIQRYLVTTPQGTKEVCCGAAVAATSATSDVIAFTPIGPGKAGICCHKGYGVELAKQQQAEVQAALKHMQSSPFRKIYRKV